VHGEIETAAVYNLEWHTDQLFWAVGGR